MPLLRFTSIKGEGHHFIPMAMEVHGAPRCDMDRFIKECVHLFHNR
jgi:hypothetical protein